MLTLLFALTQTKLFFNLLLNAPETLLPPQQNSFWSETGYRKADQRYNLTGHWDT